MLEFILYINMYYYKKTKYQRFAHYNEGFLKQRNLINVKNKILFIFNSILFLS